MLKEQRHSIILGQLHASGSVSTERLLSLTGASRSTLRRDLEELEAALLLRRVHGGAVQDPAPAVSGREPPFLERQDCYLEEKQRIARAAHDLVRPSETLLLGSGTTVYEFAKTLQDISPLYVATNDLKSALVLSEYSNVALTVLGGSLRPSHYSLNGYFAESMISQMHADKTIFSIDAIDFHLGCMNYSMEEIRTNKLALQACQQSILLCDHSKFERIAFINLCKLQEIDLLITGREISHDCLQHLEQQGVNILLV